MRNVALVEIKSFSRRAGDRFAENRLREAVGINVRRVEQVYARFQADIHEARSFCNVARSPRFEELASTAKRTRPKTESGNF